MVRGNVEGPTHSVDSRGPPLGRALGKVGERQPVRCVLLPHPRGPVSRARLGLCQAHLLQHAARGLILLLQQVGLLDSLQHALL